MFEEPIKKITLNNDITNWLKEALGESNKSSLKSHENRLSSLENQRKRVKERLSRLYDAKFDDAINKDMFDAKENEYKAQLIGIESQITDSKAVNPNSYEDGCKIFELSNRLYPLYDRANYEEKAKILSLVSSNYTLLDATLYPVYKKPFSAKHGDAGQVN